MPPCRAASRYQSAAPSHTQIAARCGGWRAATVPLVHREIGDAVHPDLAVAPRLHRRPIRCRRRCRRSRAATMDRESRASARRRARRPAGRHSRPAPISPGSTTSQTWYLQLEPSRHLRECRRQAAPTRSCCLPGTPVPCRTRHRTAGPDAGHRRRAGTGPRAARRRRPCAIGTSQSIRMPSRVSDLAGAIVSFIVCSARCCCGRLSAHAIRCAHLATRVRRERNRPLADCAHATLGPGPIRSTARRSAPILSLITTDRKRAREAGTIADLPLNEENDRQCSSNPASDPPQLAAPSAAWRPCVTTLSPLRRGAGALSEQAGAYGARLRGRRPDRHHRARDRRQDERDARAAGRDREPRRRRRQPRDRGGRPRRARRLHPQHVAAEQRRERKSVQRLQVQVRGLLRSDRIDGRDRARAARPPVARGQERLGPDRDGQGQARRRCSTPPPARERRRIWRPSCSTRRPAPR